MTQQAVQLDEHNYGGTLWVSLRARGAEYSWMTKEEAVSMAKEVLRKYGPTEEGEKS